MSDLRNAAGSFSLLAENPDSEAAFNVSCLRLIDYSRLYNPVNKKTYSLKSEIPEKDKDNLFYLKYKPELCNKEGTLERGEPYLESKQSDEINTSNYSRVLQQKDFSVIVVYNERCGGCKRVEGIGLEAKVNT